MIKGCAQFRLAILQGGLNGLEGGDVAGDAAQAGDFTLGIAQGHLHGLKRACLPVDQHRVFVPNHAPLPYFRIHGTEVFGDIRRP